MRREFVERKLQLIVEELTRLAAFRDISLDDLVGDDIRLAAVERILERIVLRAIDVNEHLIGALATGAEEKSTRLTYRDTFFKLADYDVYPAEFAQRIAPSAGLRNVLVHEYKDVDHRIVHGAVRTALDQFTEYINHVQRFVERGSGSADAVRPT